MSLRYALLALLSAGPMTGYDISRRFQSAVGHVWNAPDSQIYPELRKMELDGLVTAEEVDAGPRGRKRVYRPTDQGTEAFREWMNAPLKYGLDRDPAILRAAYLEWASPEAARRMMHDHIDHFSALLQQYDRQIFEIDERLNAVLLSRLSGLPDETQHRVAAFKRFAYEGLIARAEAEIAWAQRGLRLLDRYSPAAPDEAESVQLLGRPKARPAMTRDGGRGSSPAWGSRGGVGATQLLDRSITDLTATLAVQAPEWKPYG